MYTGILHTHKLVVVLFLLIYLVKTFLLLSGKKEALQGFTKKVKVPEMIISFLFLGTGLFMIFQIPEIRTLLIIKVILVFASIPLAIIGFKKMNKGLAALSFLLLVGAYGLAEINKRRIEKKPISGEIVSDANAEGYDAVVHGKALFMANCVACHGENGDLQNVGAKNLQEAQSSEAEVSEIIMNGKNAMPPYKKILSEDEVQALVKYVFSLRK
ncbi:c-type cytochrome [Flexithrix dorotheae]|uniref:c-type cytochrome n=1 Tax=Flexithrix dorotheae TaxID=70993 RepID=UPI000366952B|nr:cytochrome c [Flexithrix dorotheae]